jgi:hypothetical protein
MRHRDGAVVAVRATVIPLVIDDVVTAVYVGCRDVTQALAQAPSWPSAPRSTSCW